MADQRALVFVGGSYRQQVNADYLLVGNGIKSTNSQNLVLDPAGSDVQLAANKNLSMLAGTGAVDLSSASGLFKTTTGAVTIGPGTVTVSGVTTFTASGTALTVNNDANVGGDLVVDGNLTVNGTTTTVNSETVNIADNHLFLNKGYTSDAAQTGGLVVNYDPSTTADTSTVAPPSSTTITTTGSATFSAGDYIQITGGSVNDGLYRVVTHTGTTLTIATTGDDFIQTSLDTGDSTSITITKVAISVLRAGTDGAWETGVGSSGPLTFADLATAAGSTLQSSYVAGNTITTSAGEGNVTIDGTEDLVITGSVDLNWTSSGVLLIPDNDATAWAIREGTNALIAFDTSDGTEAIAFGNATTNPDFSFLGSGQVTFAGNVDATNGLDVTNAALTANSGVSVTGGSLTFTGAGIDLDPTGAFALDMDTGFAATITIADNLANAFLLREGANGYLDVNTGNGVEAMTFGNATTNPDYSFLGSGQVTFAGNVDATAGADVSGGALTFTGTNIDLDPTGTFDLAMDAGQGVNVSVSTNLATAAVIDDGTNNYLVINTTTSSEEIAFGNAVTNPMHRFLGSGWVEIAGGVLNIHETTDPDAEANAGQVYVKDVSTVSELFYRDSAGNIIQLTNNGAVNVDLSSVVNTVAEEAITAGMLVAFAAGGANGPAFKAVVTTETAKALVVGVAQTTVVAADPLGVQVTGEVTIPDALWDSAPVAADIGKRVYASTTTNGEWTLTPPSSSGNVVVKVGVISYADASADTTRVVIQIGDGVTLA